MILCLSEDTDTQMDECIYGFTMVLYGSVFIYNWEENLN